MSHSELIKFYSVNDDFGEFSNFALYPIVIDGETWKTTEHYFQAQKFEDKAYRKKVANANTPMLSATLGRDRKQKIRRDWESAKDNVMKKAVLAKFSQHEELRELLLSTGEAKLIEHTENDDYWGDGGDGKGKNKLGQILMAVRAELANERKK